MFRTEVDFTLPLGYLDADGTLHREGTMRLATAADEILPLKDPRVQQNAAYLVVILLSRVVTRLEGVSQVTPKVIEGLYSADLAHLQSLYNHMNRLDGGEPVTCPKCEHVFAPEPVPVGGVVGYPLEDLYEEVAFIAYHFHWPHDQVMSLEHAERRRWVREISAINERLNEESAKANG
jgi:hypothetical protein